MDAIRLSGNVWVNIPLRPGKMVNGMTARGEVVLILKYIYLIYIEVFNCALALVQLFMHILYACIDVFTFG